MAAEYSIAPKEILDLVANIVETHHPDLAEAHIGVLMRNMAPRTAGKRVMGKAKKVGPEQKALLPHDFLLWFAEDTWEELNELQRRALVDHELCHCTITNDKIKMKRHDIEEFHEIIERYGFWWPMADETERVMQSTFGLKELAGSIKAVQPAIFDEVDRVLEEGEEDS